MDTENKVSETVDTEVKTVSTNSSDHSLDYDALASEIGWSPKEKFRGDPAKWVDAKTYYEKGEFVLPIVKKQREEAKKDAESLRKQLAELKSAQAEFQKFTEAAAERKYKEQIAELKEARAAAVAAGDDKAFKQADDAIDDLKEQVAKKPEAKKEEAAPVDPDFSEWLDKNRWYVDDPKKKKLADEFGIYYSNTEGLKGKDLYEAVAKKVKSFEPDGTERPGPQRGGNTQGGNSKAKTFDNLLPEYKQAFTRFERNGMKMTKEQYVAKCDPDAWGA